MRSPFYLFSFVKAHLSLGVHFVSAKNKALPMLVILSLVSPIMLFGFEWKASARDNRPQEAAPVNDAPEKFAFHNEVGSLKKAFDFPLVQRIKKIADDLRTKELPERVDTTQQPQYTNPTFYLIKENKKIVYDSHKNKFFRFYKSFAGKTDFW